MTDVLDFPPAFSETLARVRVRLDADANAGLLPEDPGWIDTREGTFFWDATQPAALEFARLWDALNETAAAAFPSVAWGEYLDEHAATFGLTRHAAVAAEATVLFAGLPGVAIPLQTRIGAEPTDPSGDVITFQVTEAGVTSAALARPSGVSATATTGGTLPNGQRTYRVAAYGQYGETLPSADAAINLTGASDAVSLTWPAVSGATGYRVYSTLDPTARGGLIADVSSPTFTDTGATPPGTLEPTQDTSAGVLLPVVALEEGAAGNVGANALTNLEDVIPGITYLTNSSPAVGGADAEDDEALRGRILASWKGRGASNVADHVRWMMSVTGVERAVCIPVWNGPGTVLDIPMLADGSPVSPDVVSAVQALIDPTPGMGLGEATIGSTTTIKTTTGLNVVIVATMTLASGYSLDGDSGTIALRAVLASALNDYLQTLDPGDTIVYQQIEAALLTASEGVVGVSGLTLNGGSADVVLALTPTPEYPVLQPPTFH